MNRSTWERIVIVALLVAAIDAAGWGCGRKSGSSDGGAKSTDQTLGNTDATKRGAAEGRHGPSAVVPGSYEDWCEEHGVRETLCTRCNASLVPAFKATADWCEEHGLPESQCFACHPSLVIERPPRPEGS